MELTYQDIERLEAAIHRLREMSRVILPLDACRQLAGYAERGYTRVQLVAPYGRVHAVLIHKERNRIFLLDWDDTEWKVYMRGLAAWLKALLPPEDQLWGEE